MLNSIYKDNHGIYPSQWIFPVKLLKSLCSLMTIQIFSLGCNKRGLICQILSFCTKLSFLERLFYLFHREWMHSSEVGRARERKKTSSDTQCKAPHETWSRDPEIMTWAKTRSWMPNWLCHPGTPCTFCLNCLCYVFGFR